MDETSQVPSETDAETVEPVDRRTRRDLGKVQARSASAEAKFNESLRRKKLTRADTAEEIEAKRIEADLKARARSESWNRTKERGLKWLRAFMVAGPIMAPMSVAWTGQAGFAMRTLGWVFAAGVLYAAAYELTTVFCAWMHHEARKDGDKGWEYRIATWLFGLGAAVQQWWHYSVDWSATPRSVTFASMTIIGVIVWELYSRLIHRRKLRQDGKISASRPRIGLARWVRYPRTAWAAWSISIRTSHDTIAELWTMAEADRTRARSESTLKREIKTLKTQISDLQNGKSGKIGPAPLLNADQPDLEWLSRTPAGPPEQTAGPQIPIPHGRPAIEAGSGGADLADPAGSDQTDEEGEFRPTDLEQQAVALILSKGERLNRTTCAEAVRELDGGIATKRAADLAKWGRENGGKDGLRAIG